MRQRTLLSLLILAVTTVMPITAQWRTDNNDLAQRTQINELKSLLERDAVIVVDVRPNATYEMGHIPSAISIPLETVAERADELRGTTKAIVTYCT